MKSFRSIRVGVVVCALVAAVGAERALATGVPLDGFLPLLGIGLTDEFNPDSFFVEATSGPGGGTLLGAGGTPHYSLALLDTGAGVNLITEASDTAFGVGLPQSGNQDGFRGTNEVTLGGATGFLQAVINDPLGLYAGGLQGNAGGASLTMSGASLIGQTNTSLITVPAESTLPNVVGLPFASQYATQIRNDQPQIFQVAGQTVRTPAINFLPLGSGGHGITRRAPMSLNPGPAFANLPFYFPGFSGELDLHEDPFQATAIGGGLFLNVNGKNTSGGVTHQLGNTQFFFDTGASVTVLSELTALNLGIDVVTDTPDFSISINGSAGVKEQVPGYFLQELTVQSLGGNVTVQNVPVLVFNVTNVADPGNVVPGIIGTNFLSGRNLVIDPDPSLGGGNPGPHLYISDPVTNNSNWASAAASAAWSTGANWSAGSPTVLTIANLRHVAGGHQESLLSSNVTVWEVNVSGAAANQRMTLRVANGATLTTFTGLNIEQHGVVRLDGGSLDVQYVDIRDGGRLTGAGAIATGSGDIAGQVENVDGFVAPGNGIGVLDIEGRFANGVGGTIEIDLGGLAAGTQHDQIEVDGLAALDGTLAVSLAGGFVPALGNSFAIITADVVLGEFAAASLPALSANKMWQVTYDAAAVLLKVTIPGDFDGDFTVDGDDLAVWREDFGGVYSGVDFLTWQRNLGMSIAPIAAVPEPSALALGTIALVGIALRRRRVT